MRKKILAIGSIIVIMIMVATITLIVSAAVSFEDIIGNYDGSGKIDPPVDTTVYFNDDGSESNTPTEIYIEFDVSDDGIYLSFKATGILVTQIYLKGGESYRVYTFSPGVSEASDLVCPNNNGNNIPQISHFGLIEVGPEETTTTETTATETTATETTATETTATETTATETTATETTTTTATTATVPTTTGTDDLPKTGENDDIYYTLGTICLSLAGLGIALRKILNKKTSIS